MLSTRAVRRVALVVLALATSALAWWLATRDTRSQPARLVGEERLLRLLERPLEVRRGQARRDRLEVAVADFAEATGNGDPLAERELGLRVLSDTRDCWFAMHGSELAVELPADAQGVLLFGWGPLRLRRDPPVAVPAGVQAQLIVSLEEGEEGGARTKLADNVYPLEVDEPRAWRPFALRVDTRGLEHPRLVLEAGFRSPTDLPQAPEPLTPEFLSVAGFVWTNPVLALDAPSAAPAGPAARAQPPNVLIVSVDTLRADHLGAWGYTRATSPNVDRLLEGGVRFAEAQSSAPWTLPSYGSLFTGRYPTEHRAGVNTVRDALWETPLCGEGLTPEQRKLASQSEVLAPELITLAEALRDQGYRTAGFVNNPFLHPSRGVDQGFERYVWYGQRAEHGVDLALDWIERQQGLPFLAFVHLMDPHMPYAPPQGWDTRFQDVPLAKLGKRGLPWVLQTVQDMGAAAREWRQTLIDLYDAEIAYTDDQIGRLLAALDERGLLESTLVVFHSDHGEEFWDHGGFEHGHALGRELVHVPLGLVWPARIPAGTLVSARVRTVDVLPTLLELLGLPPSTCGLERGFEGEAAGLRATSLVPWIDGTRTDDLPSFSESLLHEPPTAKWQEAKSLSVGPWRTIVGGADRETDVLYDLSTDREETRDVSAQHPEESRRLRTRLEQLVRQARAAARASGLAEPPGDILQRLQQLGYAGGRAPGGEAPDPAAPPEFAPPGSTQPGRAPR